MTWIALVQVAAASGLGAAIGLERELSSQPAGLRTHMLVALGAALFTLAGARILGTDPTRVAAQVVTGVGFLGGGAIVREGATTRGLTTAASLWVTAAVGVAIGLREWLAGVLTTTVALLVLYSVRRMKREIGQRRRGVEITLTLAPGAALDHVEQSATRTVAGIQTVRVTYTAAGQGLVLLARPTPDESLGFLAERLRTMPGVIGVDLLG
jgi:putative Mg2+ transporter-C (MgtC) family protein